MKEFGELLQFTIIQQGAGLILPPIGRSWTNVVVTYIINRVERDIFYFVAFSSIMLRVHLVFYIRISASIVLYEMLAGVVVSLARSVNQLYRIAPPQHL